MNEQNVINLYFTEKKIKASVKGICASDDYVTYTIELEDITKLPKFNNAMEKELAIVTGKDVTLNVGKEITLIINNAKISSGKASGVTISAGKDTKGNDVSISFKNNPHWLVGGSTGSGKSVFLNNVIAELLEKYSDVIELGFIDLKQVEFYQYNNLDVNIADVANDIESAKNILDGTIAIMNERYEKYKLSGCKDIYEYNKEHENDRFLICIIDELAELILQDDSIKEPLQRILQLGRAAGIFLICATQRPSNDILPGSLKVNFTTRICFKVGNMYDSKTILNQKGAEKLAGRGDCLILRNGEFQLTRFQAYSPIDDKMILSSHKIAPEKPILKPSKTRKMEKVVNVLKNVKIDYFKVAMTILKIILFMFVAICMTGCFLICMLLWIVVAILKTYAFTKYRIIKRR